MHVHSILRTVLEVPVICVLDTFVIRMYPNICCLVAKSCSTFVTPQTVALQAPLSLGFSRQEHWSRLPLPSPVVLPNPGIQPSSPSLAGGFFTAEPSGKPSDIKIFLKPVILIDAYLSVQDGQERLLSLG